MKHRCRQPFEIEYYGYGVTMLVGDRLLGTVREPGAVADGPRADGRASRGRLTARRPGAGSADAILERRAPAASAAHHGYAAPP